MSFQPTTLELAWMESDPVTFTRLEGDQSTWGLFRFNQDSL